jgi:mannose-1-phosphate guanylyltransferase
MMTSFLEKVSKQFGIKIHCSKEETPLGTAGPVKLAEQYLKDCECFFMLNSDVICEFPMQQMLSFHRKHKGEGTIMVTEVEDPSKYGVVLSHAETGCIDSFIEKPKTMISNKINAGLYLFNPAIIKRISLTPTSIERIIFPRMVQDNTLYSMVLPGYWMDIGQPKDYLCGSVLHLRSMAEHVEEGKLLAKGAHIVGNVMIAPDVKLGTGCVIGPDVIIGAGCVIGDGVRIERSSLFRGVQVAQSAWIKSSIIGWESRIGKWSRLDKCILGEDVKVNDELFLNTVTVCPHKGVKESELSARIII